MMENIEEEAYKLLSKFKRITPVFLMKKFHLNPDCANVLCQKIWLRQHLEARKLAKELEGM